MTFFKRGKYFEIIASIAVFLALDASILGFNYFISLQLTDDAHALQLASRQTRLSQQIMSELYVVQDALEAGENIEGPVLQLTQSFRQFDEVLDSFIYGGELIGVGQGQDSLLVDTNYARVNLDLLKQIEAEWRPYRARISPVMYSIYGDNFDAQKTSEKTATAIAVARATNPGMLELLNEFSVAVERLGKNKVERLQLIQAVGIGIAITYFFILMFYFIRKLRRSDRAAETARGETEEILATVTDGLFLLDKDMIVGSQHSASLCRMLNQKDVAGVDFLKLIKPMVSAKTLSTTKEFLELMFADHVQPSLIQSLNPLDQVEMQIVENDGTFVHRHFTFSFSPVEDKGRLAHVLVSIIDITDRINLEAELDQSRQQATKQLDMLMSVIHVKPELLATGLQSTEQGLAKINELLKEPTSREDQLWKKHRNIGRIAHRIKGDCSAIELHSLANSMHEMEDELEKISEKTKNSGSKLSGNDFLPVVLKMNQTHQQIQSLRSAISLLQGLQGAIDSNDADQSEQPEVKNAVEAAIENPAEDWSSMISRLAEGIANQYNKELNVDLDDLHFDKVSDDNFAQIKDVLLQLVRNAAVHGIEKPEIRVSSGKQSKGTIRIYSGKDKKGRFICVHDDGRGIHLNEIRDQLIADQTMTAEEIDSLKPKELLKTLFKPGFSTADKVDMNAGRGIGLDLVKSSLDDCGAKLGLTFKPGLYTEFKIRLPQSEQGYSEQASSA